MPISGISNIRRMPRTDKIRLGELKESGKGTKYPVQLPYLKIPENIQALLGEKPTEIDVMFASEDPEDFFPQYRKLYGKTGLKCKGDGIKARMLIRGEDITKDCTPNADECKKCKPLGTLNVLLPKVPGFGVFSINTSSWNSIVNLNSCIDAIRLMTNGRIAFIPLKLQYKPHVGHVIDGEKEMQKTVYVLSLTIDQTIENFYTKYRLTPGEHWDGLDDANAKIASLNAPAIKECEIDDFYINEDGEIEEEIIYPTQQQLTDIQILAKKKGMSLKKQGPELAEVPAGEQWDIVIFNRVWTKLSDMPDAER